MSGHTDTDNLGKVEVSVSRLMDLAVRASGNGREGADPSQPHKRVLPTSPALVTLTIGVAAGIAAAVGVDAEWPAFLGPENLRLVSVVCIVMGILSFWRAIDHAFWVGSVEATFTTRNDVASVRSLITEQTAVDEQRFIDLHQRLDLLAEMVQELTEQIMSAKDDAFVDALSEPEDHSSVKGNTVMRVIRPNDRPKHS